MLKFVKHHMETIAGIEIFPIISFLIFFLFFIGLFLFVYGRSKKRFSEVERMPLEDDDVENTHHLNEYMP